MGNVLNTLIFRPHPPSYSLDARGLHFIQTNHGSVICGYFIDNKADITLLFSHGNAEDIGDVVYQLKKSTEKLNVNLFAYDYSGYGRSTGTPSEENVYSDVEAAYKYLREKLQIPRNKIVAYGRSLGSAASVHIASKEEVLGVVLQSPLASIHRVKLPIKTTLPYDLFCNIDKIHLINCPILFIHGKDDKLISYKGTEEMVRRTKVNTYVMLIENGGHNNLETSFGDRISDAFIIFLFVLKNNIKENSNRVYNISKIEKSKVKSIFIPKNTKQKKTEKKSSHGQAGKSFRKQFIKHEIDDYDVDNIIPYTNIYYNNNNNNNQSYTIDHSYFDANKMKNGKDIKRLVYSTSEETSANLFSTSSSEKDDIYENGMSKENIISANTIKYSPNYVLSKGMNDYNVLYKNAFDTHFSQKQEHVNNSKKCASVDKDKHTWEREKQKMTSSMDSFVPMQKIITHNTLTHSLSKGSSFGFRVMEESATISKNEISNATKEIRENEITNVTSTPTRNSFSSLCFYSNAASNIKLIEKEKQEESISPVIEEMLGTQDKLIIDNWYYCDKCNKKKNMHSDTTCSSENTNNNSVSKKKKSVTCEKGYNNLNKATAMEKMNNKYDSSKTETFVLKTNVCIDKKKADEKKEKSSPCARAANNTNDITAEHIMFLKTSEKQDNKNREVVAKQMLQKKHVEDNNLSKYDIVHSSKSNAYKTKKQELCSNDIQIQKEKVNKDKNESDKTSVGNTIDTKLEKKKHNIFIPSDKVFIKMDHKTILKKLENDKENYDKKVYMKEKLKVYVNSDTHQNKQYLFH